VEIKKQRTRYLDHFDVTPPVSVNNNDLVAWNAATSKWIVKSPSGIALPAGTLTGDIVRYNASAGAWEVKSEPLELKGIVLTPALSSLVETEGAMFYSSAEKAVMVFTT